VEVDRIEEVLRHREIVGTVQTGRKGFGLLDFGVARDGSGTETFLERTVGLGASKDQLSDKVHI